MAYNLFNNQIKIDLNNKIKFNDKIYSSLFSGKLYTYNMYLVELKFNISDEETMTINNFIFMNKDEMQMVACIEGINNGTKYSTVALADKLYFYDTGKMESINSGLSINEHSVLYNDVLYNESIWKDYLKKNDIRHMLFNALGM